MDIIPTLITIKWETQAYSLQMTVGPSILHVPNLAP
jgi:hypothetical protein